MGSHATGLGSEQPTPAQLKELFAQIESGRVTKGRMQEFLRGSRETVSIQDARSILGSGCVFGPDEWKIYLGDDFPNVTIPKIPWSRVELENPEIIQRHFLFLGLEHFRSGLPVNLRTWDVHSDLEEAHIKFCNAWYLGESFSMTVCELRWYFMPFGIVVGSEGLSYKRQVEKLPDTYEVPTISARVTANILFFQFNQKYLDSYWARTKDKYSGGSHIAIRAFTNAERLEGTAGIALEDIPDVANATYPNVGISASRKM